MKNDLLTMWAEAVDRKYYKVRVLNTTDTSSIIGSLF